MDDILTWLHRGKPEKMVLEALAAKFKFRVHNLNSHVDKDGWSMLHWATQNDFYHFACFCLQKGHKMDLKDKFGANPIMSASYLGNMSFLQMFCEGDESKGVQRPKGTSLRVLLLATNNYESTALHYAALEKRVEACAYLLTLEPRLLNLIDKNGDTALHHACNKGFDDVVLLLMDFGADANIRNRIFRLPLDLGLGSMKLGSEAVRVLHQFHDGELPHLMDHVELRQTIGSLLREESVRKFNKRERKKQIKQGEGALVRQEESFPATSDSVGVGAGWGQASGGCSILTPNPV